MKPLLFIFILTAIPVLLSCNFNTNSINEPTKDFYINDNANSFLRSTKWFIYLNGNTFYDESLKDTTIPNNLKGTQIVVVTYLGNSTDLNTTEIFNNYGPGQNDMGLMIFLFFSKNNTNELNNFDNLIVELGSQMMTQISAFELDEIINNYFYDVNTLTDYEDAIVSLYYHLIERIGLISYGWTEGFIYNTFINIDNYEIEKYDSLDPLPGESNNNLFFTDNSTVFIIVAVCLVILSFFLGRFGLIGLFLNVLGFRGSKGGGGISSGYWFKK